MLVSNESPLRNVGFRWVSDGFPMGHVGFRWVSHGACHFQMGYQLKHVEVSVQACQSPMGNVSYQWGMSVFGGSSIRHVGLG